MQPAIRELPQQAAAVDPVEIVDWDRRLLAHPGSSFFHSASWAQVLKATYGHRPYYVCRFDRDRLSELLPVMEVSSRLTGRRGVSLPFTDFCPVLDDHGTGQSLYELAIRLGRERGWRYLECRGKSPGWAGATPSLSFYGHSVDLRPSVSELFQSLDGAMRRGIKKAEAAGLQVRFETTAEAVRCYYNLHCQTRKRHGLPPQPFRLFENIERFVLAEGNGMVARVISGEQTVAAGVYFHHGKQAIYKYGASNYGFQHLRPNNLIMWNVMKHYANQGFEELHLGRTSLVHEGLRRFKLTFGAQEEIIECFKYDFKKQTFVADVDRVEGWFNQVFRALPLPLLRLAGNLLYPHLS